MPSLLTRLASLFPGYRPRPTPPPVDPALARLNLVTAVKAQLDATPSRSRPSGEEKIPLNWHGGVAGKVWFLPYLDSATRDTPEVRAAMRLMWRDGYVVAAWEPQVRTVASEDWQIQPSEAGNPEAEEQAAFAKQVVEEALAGGMPQAVRSLVSGMGPDGFTLCEPVWGVHPRGRLENKVVLAALKAKDVDNSSVRLEGDAFGNVGWVQSTRVANQERFPIEEFVYSRYMTVYDEPLGFAAFRPAYAAYWMRDTVRKLRVIHHEKRMAGFLVGTYPEGDNDAKSSLETVLRGAKTGTWASVPEGVKLEAVGLSTASEPDYRSFDESLRDEVVTAIAFATLQSIQGNVPDARGDSKVQKAMADLGPWFLMTLVSEAFNKQILPKLIDFNFPFPAAGGYPKLTFGATSNAELLELAQVVQAAVGLGLKPSRKHYAKALSIQEADPNDPGDALGAQPDPFGGFGGGMPPGGGDPFGGGDPAMLPPGGGPGGDPGAVVPFSDREHWEVYRFKDAVKWERQSNGTWRSSGGRVLSDPAYQRHLARVRQRARGRDLAKNPVLPPAEAPRAETPRGEMPVPVPERGIAPSAAANLGVEPALGDVVLGAQAVAAAVGGSTRRAAAAGRRVKRVVAAAASGGVNALKVATGRGAGQAVAFLAKKGEQLGRWLADWDWLERRTGVGSMLAGKARKVKQRFANVREAFDRDGYGRGSRKLVREVSRLLGSRWSESRKKYGVVAATAIETVMLGWGFGRAGVIGAVAGLETALGGTTGYVATKAAYYASGALGGHVRRAVEYPAKLAVEAVTGKSFRARARTAGAGRVAQAIEWADRLKPRALARAAAGRSSLKTRLVGVAGSRDGGGEITPKQAAEWAAAAKEVAKADAEGRKPDLDPATEGLVRRALAVIAGGAEARRGAEAARDRRNAARANRIKARKTRLGRSLPFAEGGDVSGLVVELRAGIDDVRAAQGLGPTEATDAELAGALVVALEEFAKTLAPVAESFAEVGVEAFADRKDGEQWETNGRWYERQGGRTRRIADPKAAPKAGGGGWAVTDLRPGKGPPARPGKELTDVTGVRKARTRAEGPDPEAKRAADELAAKVKAGDTAAVTRLQTQAVEAAARAAPPQPLAPEVADRVVRASLGRRAAGKVGGAVADFLRGAVGSQDAKGVSGWLGGAVRSLVGGLAKLGGWAVKAGFRLLVGAAKKLGSLAYRAASSDTGRVALLWGGSIAAAAAFMAAPVLAVSYGLIPKAAAVAAVPVAAAAAWLTPKVIGRAVTRVAPVVGADRHPWQNSERFAEGGDFALAGPDGARADALTAVARKELARLFAEKTKAATERLLASGDPAGAAVLYDDAELAELAAGLSKVIATADLLGRARIRRRAKMADAAGKFAEGDDPFHDFAEPVPLLAPAKAIEYVRGKVPEVDPGADRYGDRLDRHATTMAIAADQTVLDRIKGAIVKELEGGGDSTPDIDQILTDAGLHPDDPQYAEMVARTNVNDALNAGAADEMQSADMREAFPVWQYLGILDSRTGDDHRPKIGKYYPVAANFADVRGNRIWNCRCGFAPVHRSMAENIRVEERW